MQTHERYPYYRLSDSKDFTYSAARTGDPYAVYLFIKGKHVDVDLWNETKYQCDARVLPGAKILDLSLLSTPIAMALFKEAGFRSLGQIFTLGKMKIHNGYDNPDEEVRHLFSDQYDPRKDTPSEDELKEALVSSGLGHFVFRIIRVISHAMSPHEFSQIFVRAGYDCLLDTVDAIYPGEPQLLVFDEKLIEWGIPFDRKLEGNI